VLGELQQKECVPFKLMLGHAGWSKGQLEKEIANGDWLMQATTADFIFNVPSNQMWRQATESLGLDLGPTFGMGGQA
jgi:Putative transcriptional regulator